MVIGEGSNKFIGKELGQDPPSNPPNNTWWDTKKTQIDTCMWFEIHKIPTHNTKECQSIKNLMT